MNSETRRLFSQNLRKLIQREDSITSLCRALQINRTQFNRYLSGDAMPQAAVLKRICDHFDVDPRILYEPLEYLVQERAAVRVGFLHLSGELEPAPHVLLPDGLYQCWAPAPRDPALIARNLCRVATVRGMREIRSKTRHGDALTAPGNAPMTTTQGIAFRQLDGFVAAEIASGTAILQFTAFRCGWEGEPDLFAGMRLSGHSLDTAHSHQVQPVLWHRLPRDTGAVLRAARLPRLLDRCAAPEHVTRILNRIQQDAQR